MKRGSTTNPHNKFLIGEHHVEPEYLEYCLREGDEPESVKTQLIPFSPKTILTKNNSPDVPFTWSINPYQGCEHGCVYCYARNTHEYWGYSAGKDFEQKILYKANAPELLRHQLRKKSWQPDMIALSGNTDCYQPVERKLQITRQLLEIMLEHKHPVGVITKNSLILRDLDLLVELNKLNLLRLTLSITTLSEETRRAMEPRTASVKQRLKALEVLTNAGIRVNVNMAPIIPGINNHEVFDLVKTVGELGANSVNYLMVRLNGQIADIFTAWVRETMPDRADKVLNQIKDMHGGNLNDSRFRTRMRGQGKYAEQIRDMVVLARKKFVNTVELLPLDTEIFVRNPGEVVQGKLF